MDEPEYEYRCKNCKRQIGKGPNSWLRVSNHSITAASPNRHNFRKHVFVDVEAAHGIEVLEGCTVMRLNCLCEKRLGMRCTEVTNTEKKSYLGRYILRSGAFEAKLPTSADSVPLIINEGGISAVDDKPTDLSHHDAVPLVDRSVASQGRPSLTESKTSQTITLQAPTPGNQDVLSALAEMRGIISQQADTIGSIQQSLLALQAEVSALKQNPRASSGDVDSMNIDETDDSAGSSYTNGRNHLHNKKMRETLSRRRTLHSPQVSESPILQPQAPQDTTNEEPTADSEASLSSPGISSANNVDNPTPHQLQAAAKGLRIQSLKKTVKESNFSGSTQQDTGTQQYLRDNVPDYDPDDSDFVPATKQTNIKPNPSTIQQSTTGAAPPSTPSAFNPSLGAKSTTPPQGHQQVPFKSPRGRPKGSRKHSASTPRAWENETPPWEDPDFDSSLYPDGYTFGPKAPTSARAQSIKRRGVSSTTAARSTSNPTTPTISTNKYTHKRQRDEEGYLIMPDGKRDMRSFRGPRNSEGLLITATGKVDGRSARGRRRGGGGPRGSVLANRINSPGTGPSDGDIAPMPESENPSFAQKEHRDSDTKGFTELNGSTKLSSASTIQPQQEMAEEQVMIKEELAPGPEHEKIMHRLFRSWDNI